MLFASNSYVVPPKVILLFCPLNYVSNRQRFRLTKIQTFGRIKTCDFQPVMTKSPLIRMTSSPTFSKSTKVGGAGRVTTRPGSFLLTTSNLSSERIQLCYRSRNRHLFQNTDSFSPNFDVNRKSDSLSCYDWFGPLSLYRNVFAF